MHENGIPVIYMRLKKTIYGTLQMGLLFWKDLKGTLKDWGFELNPYEDCVTKINIYRF